MPSVAISCAACGADVRRARRRARPLLRGRDGGGEEARRAGHALEHALLPRPGAGAARRPRRPRSRTCASRTSSSTTCPSQQGAIYFHSYLADVLTNRGEIDEAEASLAALGLEEEVAESGHVIFFLGRSRLAALCAARLRGRGVGLASGSAAAWRPSRCTTPPCSRGGRTSRWRCSGSTGATRRSSSRARRSSWRGRGARRGRSASRCARAAWPRAGPRGSRRCASRSRCLRDRRRGSSGHARWSSWAPRCGGRTSAPKRASC